MYKYIYIYIYTYTYIYIYIYIYIKKLRTSKEYVHKHTPQNVSEVIIPITNKNGK